MALEHTDQGAVGMHRAIAGGRDFLSRADGEGHVPLNRFGLRFVDPEEEREFTARHVDAGLARLLPAVCAAMGAWHAAVLVQLTRAHGAGTLARGEPTTPATERGAVWLMAANLACWLLLGIAGRAYGEWLRRQLERALSKVASHGNGSSSIGSVAASSFAGRAMTAGLVCALLVDAAAQLLLELEAELPESVVALRALLAPLLVAGFLPVGPGVLAAPALALPVVVGAGRRARPCTPGGDRECGAVARALDVLALETLLLAMLACRWLHVVGARCVFHRVRVARERDARAVAKRLNDAALASALREGEARRSVTGALEAAAAARARLIRVLTHNIRSPLLVADNVSEEIDQCAAAASRAQCALSRSRGDVAAADAPSWKGLPAKLKASARSLHHACVRMEHVLSDLAEFELLESNTLSVQPAPFTLGELRHVVEDLWRPHAELANAPLHVSLDEALAPLRVLGDLGRLAQCVGAGISNALNASAERTPVFVTFALAPQMDQVLLNAQRGVVSARQEWVLVRVVVTDRGAGLAADELEALRQGSVFPAVSRSQLNGEAATGVGLARTRMVLQLHSESTMRLSSDGLGRGAVFELSLKLRLDLAQPGAHGARLAAWLASGEGGGALPHYNGAALARELSESVPSTPIARSPRSTGLHARLPTRGAVSSLREAFAPGGLSGVATPRVTPRSMSASPRPCAAPPSSSRAVAPWPLPTAPAERPHAAAPAATCADDQPSVPQTARSSADAGAADAAHGERGDRPASSAPPPRAHHLRHPHALSPHSATLTVAPQSPNVEQQPSPTPHESSATLADTPRFPPHFRVLYAEDDAVLRRSIVLRVFKPLGLRVSEATDGDDALAQFRAAAAPPDEQSSAAGGAAAPAGFSFVLLDNQVSPAATRTPRRCGAGGRLGGGGGLARVARHRRLMRAAPAPAHGRLSRRANVRLQMPKLTGAQVARTMRALGFGGPIVGMTGDPAGCKDRAEFEAAGLDVCLDKGTQSVRRVKQMLIDLGAALCGIPDAENATGPISERARAEAPAP